MATTIDHDGTFRTIFGVISGVSNAMGAELNRQWCVMWGGWVLFVATLVTMAFLSGFFFEMKKENEILTTEKQALYLPLWQREPTTDRVVLMDPSAELGGKIYRLRAKGGPFVSPANPDIVLVDVLIEYLDGTENQRRFQLVGDKTVVSGDELEMTVVRVDKANHNNGFRITTVKRAPDELQASLVESPTK